MAKRRRSQNAIPPFVAITWGILNSTAYKNLSPSAAKALPYFLGKYKGPWHDAERYTFEFSFTYSEAARYGFSTRTFARIIKNLVEVGFIDGVDRGGLRGEGKGCSTFRLSRRWENYGAFEFETQQWGMVQPQVRTPLYKWRMDNCTNGACKGSNGRNSSAKVKL